MPIEAKRLGADQRLVHLGLFARCTAPKFLYPWLTVHSINPVGEQLSWRIAASLPWASIYSSQTPHISFNQGRDAPLAVPSC